MRMLRHIIIVRLLGVVLVAVAVASLAACDTTGDPRQGGLFGWSSFKADDRKHALEALAASERRAASEQQAASQQYAAQQSQLQTQVGDLRAQLNALLAENASLARQVESLSKKKRLAASDLKRVKKELGQNVDVREAAHDQLSASATGTASARAMMKQQNDLLHEEVRYLLQQ